MTIEETAVVMDILTGAYPRFYAGASDEAIDSAMDVWSTVFAHDDSRLVIAAVRSFIESDEKGFPPVPGQIKAKMRLITEPDDISAMEAWALVAKALKNCVYGAKEEFEKFPPLVKRIVHDPEQLRAWGLIDSETVHSVVASNFRESFNRIAAKEREFGKLPADVRKIAASLRLTQENMAELPVSEDTAKTKKKTEGKKGEGTVPMPEFLKRQLMGNSPQAQSGEQAAHDAHIRRSREEIIAILRGSDCERTEERPAPSGAGAGGEEEGTGV